MEDQQSDDDPVVTLKLLLPLLAVVYRGYEEAVEKVRAYFQEGKLTYSPYAFSALVRCHLHDFVSAPRWTRLRFKLFRLSNDGIDIEYRGCRLKAWKGADELPASQSDAREAYLYQPSLFPLGTPGAPPRKLVVTWELNAEDRSLKRLFLICPKWDGSNADVHWIQEIPHPATMISAGLGFASVGDLDDLDDEKHVGREGQ